MLPFDVGYLWQAITESSREFAVLSVLLFVLVSATAYAQQGAQEGQWRYYSGDAGSTKYAPLDQIDKNNVHNLRIAWRRPAVAPRYKEDKPGLSFSNNFRATPLMIDGVLYSPNGIGLVEAFEAGSGETLWLQEPVEEGEQRFRGSTTRGAAYWTGNTVERILVVKGQFL